MTITINGTTGIAGVDGSAATPSVQGADTNTGMFFPAADTIAFTEGGTEVMRINSSGNVGIGTTTPSNKLSVSVSPPTASSNGLTVTDGTRLLQSHITGATYSYNGVGASENLIYASGNPLTFLADGQPIKFNAGTAERMRISSAGDVSIGTNAPAGKLHVRAATNQNLVIQGAVSLPNAVTISAVNDANNANVPLEIRYAANVGFWESGVERMRIDSSGNLLVGTTSPLFVNSHTFVNSGQAILGLRNSGATAGLYWQVGPDGNNNFKVFNQASVGVYVGTGATAWSASSDETLKNITGTIQNGLQKVASLRAAEFSWKTDDTSKSQVGLIAQDVQKVLPEAVDVSSDGTLGVRYTEVIPLLVAAIQEQQAMITALTDRITALEAK